MGLPSAFCWSKFGTEAGEPASAIIERKEAERESCAGTFLWGIGTSIGPSLRPLLESEPEPLVLFTPMRSPAATRDRSPASVVVWQTAFAFDGGEFLIPPGVTVTSGGRSRQRHFALVCHCDEPLPYQTPELWLDDKRLRNLRSGSPIGASQVTSVVRAVGDDPGTPRYRVAFAARLREPFLLVLEDPVDICEPLDLESAAVETHRDQLRLLQ